MFKAFQSGDQIVLELNNSDIVYGTFYEASEKRIDIKNVSNRECSTISKGLISFYTREIISIRMMSLMSTCQCQIPKNKLEYVIGISAEDLHRYNKMALDHKYIHQKDTTYHKACQTLLNSENVAVAALPCDFQRNGSLSYLILATWQEVFIFNISSCQHQSMYRELKDILESPEITKIVHDSRGLYDLLKTSHRVKMKRVFDTQIADLMVRKRDNNTEIDLADFSKCLETYFNMPSNFINKKVKTRKVCSQVLPDEIKFKVSQIVTYSFPLKECLQSKLLSEFYDTMNAEYKTP